MKLDIAAMSSRLASDEKLTDYDFWRAIKMIDDAFYRLERDLRPIPMHMIYARRVLREARHRRGQTRT